MTAIAAPTAALPAAPTPAAGAKSANDGFDALMAIAGRKDDTPAPRAPARAESKSDARDDDARSSKPADRPVKADSKAADRAADRADDRADAVQDARADKADKADQAADKVAALAVVTRKRFWALSDLLQADIDKLGKERDELEALYTAVPLLTRNLTTKAGEALSSALKTLES